MKKILASIFLLSVCALFLAYYLGKDREPARGSRGGGARWELARPALKQAFLEQLGGAFDGEKVAVPPEVLPGAAGCMAERAIAFLAGNRCSLACGPRARGDRLRSWEQAACLQRCGYPEELRSITLQCLREELPDDWRMAVPAMRKELQLQLVADGIPFEAARAQSSCYARMAAVALNESGCRLIDRRASRIEGLIGGPESCLDRADMKSELERFMRMCTGGKYPVAARGGQPDAGTGAGALDPSTSLQGIVPLRGKQCPLDYHSRGKLCLHSELLSLEPGLLESIIRSYEQGGPVPLVRAR